jgi:hypothetical protein
MKVSYDLSSSWFAANSATIKAHTIRNKRTQASQAVGVGRTPSSIALLVLTLFEQCFELDGTYRWALSGTPGEFDYLVCSGMVYLAQLNTLRSSGE